MDQLRNIGKVSSARLKSVGITTPSELEALGAVEAYRLVKEAFPSQTSLNLLYALEGAILDLAWHDLPLALRERLRVAADATDSAP
jgi:hypothetical protein